jgi:hypothetical protein
MAVVIHKRKRTYRINKQIRDSVWDTYIGANEGKGSCYCNDDHIIDSKHFECGHVVSRHNGGADSVENLRPVCEKCNKYMGTMDMNEYKLMIEQNGAVKINSADTSNNSETAFDFEDVTVPELLHYRNFYDIKCKKDKKTLYNEINKHLNGKYETYISDFCGKLNLDTLQYFCKMCEDLMKKTGDLSFEEINKLILCINNDNRDEIIEILIEISPSYYEMCIDKIGQMDKKDLLTVIQLIGIDINQKQSKDKLATELSNFVRDIDVELLLHAFMETDK